MMTDPIADMLTRIRNAYHVRKIEVIFPYSKLKLKIAEILVREGYLAKVEVNAETKTPIITVALKYVGREPVLQNLKRISKPGSRFYVQNDKIGKVLNGFGLSILSTSRGIMTDKEAAKEKIGGEVLCEVY